MSQGIFDNPVVRFRSTTTTERTVSLQPLAGLGFSLGLIALGCVFASRPQVISQVRLIRNGTWEVPVRVVTYGYGAGLEPAIIGMGRGRTQAAAKSDANRIASLYMRAGVKVRVGTPKYKGDSYEF
jgi:hypothetical protein